ncbi:hypothetical protein SAY86_031991 [Trapa natans]|uniref:Uncharacterized protein n=1 Tax=Trapa natans TaxID=22666 RepID=A0AAN7LMQ8_TRANT|nr:hypothetical protein SAY86_031991 [Trapa natans]
MSLHGGKYSSFESATGLPSSSSSAATPGLVAFGQMANYGYGSTATMEKSFRNCSISTGGGGGGGSLGGVGGSVGHNFGWITVDSYPYSSRPPYDKPGYDMNEDLDEHEVGEEAGSYSAREIETLPLFPMHDDINGFCSIKHDSDGGPGIWYDDVFLATTSRTSLELSLNSYCVMSPGSP